MKIAVTIPTLTSHNHIVDDIERGVKVYNSGGVEFMTSDTRMIVDSEKFMGRVRKPWNQQ